MVLGNSERPQRGISFSTLLWEIMKLNGSLSRSDRILLCMYLKTFYAITHNIEIGGYNLVNKQHIPVITL